MDDKTTLMNADNGDDGEIIFTTTQYVHLNHAYLHSIPLILCLNEPYVQI